MTIARGVSSNRLNSVDLPTFGLPRTTTWRPSRTSPAAARVAEQIGDAVYHTVDFGGHGRGVDEVVALIGEVDRGLEAGDQVEQRTVDLADALRDGALELVEGDPGLQGGHGIDEVADRFRLHQIHPAVQECPQRELSRLGEPRAPVYDGSDDLAEQHRVAMTADLDDVLAGVRMGPREERHKDPVHLAG